MLPINTILLNAIVAAIILFTLIDAKDERIIVNPFEAIKNALYSEWSQSNCIHAVKEGNHELKFYNETEEETEKDGKVIFRNLNSVQNDEPYNETERELEKDGKIIFNSSHIYSEKEGNYELKFYNEEEEVLEKDGKVVFKSVCVEDIPFSFRLALNTIQSLLGGG